MKLKNFFLQTAAVSLSLIGPASAARLETHSYESAALGRSQPYGICIPDNASPERRLPTLYILHGAYGSHVDWPKGTPVVELADRYQMILVFPDGGEFGWYVDSPTEKQSQYETATVKELIAEVDGKFPTLTGPGTRSIMGLSMGGHGALTLAMKHRELFTSASALSGILDLTLHGQQWEIAKRLGPLDENRALWEANSALQLSTSLVDSSPTLPLLFDCGSEDKAAIADNRAMHAELVRSGIPHIYREFPGNHSWEYWGTHLREHLNFHQAYLVAATPNTERWFDRFYTRIRLFMEENQALAIQPATGRTVAIVGSSSAQAFKADLLPGYRVFNRGIAADRIGINVRSRGLSTRLEETLFDMKPDAIVLKIGRNDLSAAQSGDGTPTLAEMVERYEQIILEVRRRLPETRLILTSSFPVRGRYERLKEPILPWNEELRKLAAKYELAYLDVHTLLIGEDGLARPEITSDGLHLTRPGYQVWAELIQTELDRLAPLPAAESEAVPPSEDPANPPGDL